MNIKINDIVGRISYSLDIPFRVIHIYEENGESYALLHGDEIRLIADAPVKDLQKLDPEARNEILKPFRTLVEQSQELFKQDYRLIKERQIYESNDLCKRDYQLFQMPGKVLHVDGDAEYLKKCMEEYKKIGIPIYGTYCNEKDMPYIVPDLVDQYRPDILVVTGHDSYSRHRGKKKDLNAYRHSRDFVKTVLEVRKKHPNLDQLIIFAGACQSHFESLIGAGANFASSPMRVNIHALDPVYIVAKISFTPFTERIHVWDVLRNTITGERGIGGIETKGVLRTGMPYHPKLDEEN
ncbi:MAG: sporulation peptidase YabG [Caldibacillus debilis]|jgi:spore coat assembly protein|uniref:Sporulation peptidase YabG n=2 Tax=Caldibacillus debilis TaxID=301148 RepID=A0A420VIA1_9BACI|nr:sporulation peptidase YabG [Caldibacillus debilis]MBO2481494.1 sporulation peptidase YabG [Bacillaceae bacterium]MBY6271178.1 sporulation peptidase YabG [Bacillaceae bacterium]OUM92791.1 MAG: sporulation peptidase YabG [Caldibacillus debilis]REJ19114.1 MAG: sporulation peptidase YabG [Caldibacillus debilis]REJ23767.1 MAG: sporulation peptidase YabG [Caldibacillus debilis]